MVCLPLGVNFWGFALLLAGITAMYYWVETTTPIPSSYSRYFLADPLGLGHSLAALAWHAERGSGHRPQPGHETQWRLGVVGRDLVVAQNRAGCGGDHLAGE